MSSEPAVAPGPAGEPNHWWRFLTLWLVATVIAMPLVIIFVGPLLAPNGSEEAAGQRTIMTVLAAVGTPVILLVMLYLAYAAGVLPPAEGRGARRARDPRQRETASGVDRHHLADGARARRLRHLRTRGALRSWLGQRADPLTAPSGPKLPVQVIAQQWLFTYRYPTYGGVETYQLVLPVDENIEFHVTSLDVVHSFWAYKIGVKADANPGVDNIAYVKPTKLESFKVRCAELCGLWQRRDDQRRQGRERERVQHVDSRTAEDARAGNQGAAEVQQDLHPGTNEAAEPE